MKYLDIEAARMARACGHNVMVEIYINSTQRWMKAMRGTPAWNCVYQAPHAKYRYSIISVDQEKDIYGV